MGSCKNCDKCNWNILMPCRVCVLTNNNTAVKKVCWCELCSAYICKAHWGDYAARTVAALKSLFIKKPDVQKMKTEEVIEKTPVAESVPEMVPHDGTPDGEIPQPEIPEEETTGKKRKRKKHDEAKNTG